MRQSTLFATKEYAASTTTEETWCADDWETPPEVAAVIASLITDDEERIIEPSAGRGAIAKLLPSDRSVTCVEINPLRHMVGAATHQEWLCTDFISYAKHDAYGFGADLIIGNPPFSLGMEFLAAAASILKPDGRILFLLPTEFFQATCRAQPFKESGLVISHQWQIAGRVAFVKEGVVHKGRQCSDSIFEFRHASAAAAAIELIDPYGRLK